MRRSTVVCMIGGGIAGWFAPAPDPYQWWYGLLFFFAGMLTGLIAESVRD